MAKCNKFFKRVALLSLVLCLCMSFAACGGNQVEGGGDGSSTAPSTTQGNTTYTISVSTATGAVLEGISVYIYSDSTMKSLETEKPLGEDGTVSFEAVTSDSYVAVLMGVPEGYDVKEYYAISGAHTEIVLAPGVIAEEKPADKVYQLGDVMYDFTITDSTGEEHTLSQLLQEKDAVVLNFWYLNCDDCQKEFSYLEMAYEEFSDSIEVLAINCEDGNDAALNTFAFENDLTFSLAIGDKDYWSPAAYTVCSTTVVIDRFGTIVYMHTGCLEELAPYIAMFRTVTEEDYSQVLIENAADLVTEDDYRRDGTQERPYELGGALEFDVKVPANGLVYYNLYRLMDVTMRIENPDAYVIVEGETYYPVDGVIELQVSCEDTMKPLNVAFGNTSGEKNTVHVEFVFAPGNVNNPIELVLGTNEVVVNEVNGLGLYYTYTAPTAGTLVITVEGCTEQAEANIQLYNENTYEAVYDSAVDSETGLITYSIHVNAGDRVQIIIGASTIDPEMVLESVTIQALASLVEDGGNGVLDGKEEYAISVVDQDGNPVPGARVQLTSGSQNTTLVTDETGLISIRLTESAYFLELTVPSGYQADVTSFLWSPAMKDLVIEVYTTAAYTVQLQTQDQLPLQNVTVWVYGEEACETPVYVIVSGEDGTVTFIGRTGQTYYLTLSGVEEPLVAEALYVTEGENTVITLSEPYVAPSYALDDVLGETEITDIDGNVYNLQEVLQSKDMIILAFWNEVVAECDQHLVVMQQLYETYGENIAIFVLNPTDMQEQDIRNYQNKRKLTMPMAKCDPELAQAFHVTAFPATVVIDREGMVCLMQEGALTAEQGEAIVQLYTAEDYTHMSFKSVQALLDYVAASKEDTQNPEDETQPEEGEGAE